MPLLEVNERCLFRKELHELWLLFTVVDDVARAVNKSFRKLDEPNDFAEFFPRPLFEQSKSSVYVTAKVLPEEREQLHALLRNLTYLGVSQRRMENLSTTVQAPGL